MDPIEEMREKINKKYAKVLEGCWVSLRKEGARYFGRIVGAKTKEEALALTGRAILLNPALEVLLQMQQAPDGRIAKMPMVLPLGMLGSRCDVRVVDPSEIIFFEDMTEDDRTIHQSLVVDGLNSTEQTKVGDVSELQSRILPPTAPVHGHSHGNGRR